MIMLVVISKWSVSAKEIIKVRPGVHIKKMANRP